MSTFLYNPDRKGRLELIDEFVVRNGELKEIMADIESSKMETPEQHYLIVGQRGTGKTTLLHRIKYAIEDSKKLNRWLIPVVFTEEQYNVSELANIWKNVGHILEDDHGFMGLYAEMEKNIAHADFEERCYDILETHLARHKKKLILLIDNIGDLLKKLEEKEIRRLREILQTKAGIRIVAGSTFYLDSLLDYQQPLYEFFKVIRLEGLTKEETEKLLLKLGELHDARGTIEDIIAKTPGRIETLRILTGGVPRTIALMFKIFIDSEHESSLKDLEKILDAVTPLYKHRMDDLPKQQQKIVDAVAKNWDPISVKDLIDKVRLEGKVISAQLRQLQKNQVIEKIETDTKNHLYSMKERFWNIWYLMRYGRKNEKEGLLFFVKFLECCYSNSELENKVQAFIYKIKNSGISESMLEFYGKIYSSIQTLEVDTLLSLQDALPNNIINTASIDIVRILNKAMEKILNKNYSEAVNLLLKIKPTDTKGQFLLLNFFSDIPESNRLEFYTSLTTSEGLFGGDNKNLLYYYLGIYAIASNTNAEINEENRFELINSAFKMIKQFLTYPEYNINLNYVITHFLLRDLIANSKANIVLSFFTDSDEKLKDRFQISYLLALYFSQGQDESILLKISDEKKQVLLQEIMAIHKQQNESKEYDEWPQDIHISIIKKL